MLDLLTRLFSALFPSCGKVMYIGGSDILPPPLSNAEEQQLLAQAADGSEAAKQRLIPVQALFQPQHTVAPFRFSLCLKL